MRPSVRRSLATVAIAPLLALTAIACGDSSDDTDDTSASSGSSTAADREKRGDGDVADETPAPDSDRTEQGGGARDLPSGDDLDVGEFAEQFRAGQEAVTTASVDVRVDFAGEGGIGDGILDLTGDRDALQLNLSDQGSDEQGAFYMIDGTVFLKEDATSSDKFIQLEPELNEGLSVYALFHPYQLTDVFLDHLRAVEHQGSEEIEGTPTEHYLLTIDPEALLVVMGPLAQGGDMPESVQQHLWLDSEGRMVRSRAEMAEEELSVMIEMSLSDFGKPQPVEPPPASEIDDLSDLR